VIEIHAFPSVGLRKACSWRMVNSVVRHYAIGCGEFSIFLVHGSSSNEYLMATLLLLALH